ncbi:adenosine receptor A1-like [Pleurodeles waltl]|uniref:adenosine receptor A1-like n=1 Tax=Pleurodeles waltl TaxID=8319 RepID=UPI0037093F28
MQQPHQATSRGHHTAGPDSDGENVGQPVFRTIILVAGLTLAVAMALCNSLTLAVVCKRSRRRRSGTAVAMMSMGVADGMLCLWSVPMLVFLERDVVLPYSLCLALTCSTLGWAIVSSFHHILIAVQRWRIVAFPTRHKDSQLCLSLQIAVCWVAGGLVSWLPALVWGSQHICHLPSPASSCIVLCAYQNVLSMDYLVYIVFDGCVLVPFLTIAALYALVFGKLRKQQRHHPRHTSYYRRQQNINRSLAGLVVIYALSRLPFNVVAMLRLYCPGCWFPPWLVPTSLMLATFSAASNPFMYYFRSSAGYGNLCQVLFPNRVGVINTVDKPDMAQQRVS